MVTISIRDGGKMRPSRNPRSEAVTHNSQKVFKRQRQGVEMGLLAEDRKYEGWDTDWLCCVRSQDSFPLSVQSVCLSVYIHSHHSFSLLFFSTVDHSPETSPSMVTLGTPPSLVSVWGHAVLQNKALCARMAGFSVYRPV